VVEDELPAAHLVQFYLAGEGFIVRIASDGPTGESAFRQAAPDLAIPDLMQDLASHVLSPLQRVHDVTRPYRFPKPLHRAITFQR
jgi:DNA-binding response OmpR family regulator